VLLGQLAVGVGRIFVLLCSVEMFSIKSKWRNIIFRIFSVRYPFLTRVWFGYQVILGLSPDTLNLESERDRN